ncbi:RidA family protein [Rhizobium jaguaris]|uniref:RidA family protein n=1 Tax=Rhizobium jaguaris TaxID=1312183 RepID=A0A387FLL8_9HYPH|nr:RidA family protein [Rhizobium jaguaris]AYG58155.1 RidA family protein [Rhizobium jaguaris]
MAHIESRLTALGLQLPQPIKLPPDVVLRFPWVRIHGNRAFISGHGALAPDGSIATPLGKVGRDLSLEEAYHAAKLTGLAMLASLKVPIPMKPPLCSEMIAPLDSGMISPPV